MTTAPTIGVLALQGDVREHLAALDRAGATGRPVRRAEELEGLAGLVLPGGESTTMAKLCVPSTCSSRCGRRCGPACRRSAPAPG